MLPLELSSVLSLSSPARNAWGRGTAKRWRGPSRARMPQVRINRFKYRRKRTIDVFIGDTNNSPAPRTEKCVPPCVMSLLDVAAMRGAVDFHNQPRADAGEIRNVGPDGMLPAKFHVIEAQTQARPQYGLGICQAPAKRPGRDGI